MMKRFPPLFLLAVLLLCGLCKAKADVFFVAFTDKDSCGCSLSQPQQFLTQRALDRRAAANISVDSLDLPVTPAYLRQIKAAGGYVLNVSRWFNGASVRINDSVAFHAIEALPFIKSMECTQHDSWGVNVPRHYSVPLERTTSDRITSAQLFAQMNLQPLHTAGFRGAGKVVAIIDGGFPGVNNTSPFDSVRPRILGTKNYAYPGQSVYANSLDHGSRVLSVMAGKKSDISGDIYGTAPDASYYLLLTEITEKESPLEMDNWVAAVEYADSLGVDVCSTSLGYFYFDNYEFDLSYAMMDGRSTRSSLAATLAAHRNMLIVNAVGNEGLSGWHYITTPSDAEDILGVGAVDIRGVHANFSSYGPSSDQRVKPDLSALGVDCPLSDGSGTITTSNGTSFACPALAGAATSLWSALPHLTALELRQLLIEHASQYLNPDDELGYGIPDIYESYLAMLETGVEEVDHATMMLLSKKDVVFYQIPASGQVKVFNNQGIEMECFHVEHGVGRLDISAWPNGLYFFRYSNGQTTVTEKFIK